MAKKKSSPLSNEAKQVTDNIVKRSGKVSEDKANRKALRQAIDQGIADYRKQHQAKVREKDKRLKKALNDAEQSKRLYQEKLASVQDNPENQKSLRHWLPWFLLAISWLGFTVYITFNGSI